MLKKLMLAVFMVLIMTISVSAFNVPSETEQLDAIGSITVDGTITVTELGNLSIDDSDTTIEFDDDGQGDSFNVSVDLSVGANNGGTQDVTYSFKIAKDVAGVSNGELTLTDGSDSKDVNIRLEVSQLSLEDLDVKAGGEKDSNIQDESDGYDIDVEAKPGDSLEFNFNLENLFSGDDDDREGDIQIESINVEVVIEDIDDDDDLEDDVDVDDIDADDDISFSIDFVIPKKAASDDYKVVINIEAEDEEGNNFDFSKEMYIEVNRDSHKVAIDDASFVSSVLKCDRSTTLNVDLINLGDKNEDEVKVTVVNSALGINLAESNLELDEDPDDDDNEMTLRFPITISDDVVTGTYTIQVRTYYDSDRVSDAMNIDLEVAKCTADTPVEEEEEEEEDVVIVPTQPPEEEEEPEETVAQPVKTGSTPVIKESFTDSVWFIVLLVLVNLAIVVLVIYLIVRFLTR